MRALAVAATAATAAMLTVAGSAWADHLDPQVRIRPADQARARAMLLRIGDLAPGHAVERTSGLAPHLDCKALDESDLTLTGKARSPYWARQLRIVGSAAVVYRTAKDSARAWARSTSAGGLRCLLDGYTQALVPSGSLRVTLAPIPFPRVTERTVAHRLTIGGAGPGSGAQLALDLVRLKQGRAHALLVFAAVAAAPERGTELDLARLVAGRMRKAMRGS